MCSLDKETLCQTQLFVHMEKYCIDPSHQKLHINDLLCKSKRKVLFCFVCLFVCLFFCKSDAQFRNQHMDFKRGRVLKLLKKKLKIRGNENNSKFEGKIKHASLLSTSVFILKSLARLKYGYFEILASPYYHLGPHYGFESSMYMLQYHIAIWSRTLN